MRKEVKRLQEELAGLKACGALQVNNVKADLQEDSEEAEDDGFFILFLGLLLLTWPTNIL